MDTRGALTPLRPHDYTDFAVLGGGPAVKWIGMIFNSSLVELIVPMQRGPSAPGVVVHRVRHVGADEIVAIAGLAVTTPVRTLVDLASVVDDHTLRRAAESAIARRLVTGPAVLSWLDRAGSAGRPGVRRLRRALASIGGFGSGPVRASARLVG